MKRTVAIVLLLAMLISTPALAASSKVNKLLKVAKKQIGKPYELVSNAPHSFNCVSFVMYCYNQVAKGTITEDGIRGKYRKIKSIKSVKPGDIVCFKNASGLEGILGCHYGIYLGKGYFINAKNRREGVTISKIKSYKKRFTGAVRIF